RVEWTDSAARPGDVDRRATVVGVRLRRVDVRPRTIHADRSRWTRRRDADRVRRVADPPIVPVVIHVDREVATGNNHDRALPVRIGGCLVECRHLTGAVALVEAFKREAEVNDVRTVIRGVHDPPAQNTDGAGATADEHFDADEGGALRDAGETVGFADNLAAHAAAVSEA